MSRIWNQVSSLVTGLVFSLLPCIKKLDFSTTIQCGCYNSWLLLILFKVIQKRCRPLLRALISHNTLPCLFSYTSPGINLLCKGLRHTGHINSQNQFYVPQKTLYVIFSHFANDNIILFYLKSSFKIFYNRALMEP